jgi:hypothetical protein
LYRNKPTIPEYLFVTEVIKMENDKASFNQTIDDAIDCFQEFGLSYKEIGELIKDATHPEEILEIIPDVPLTVLQATLILVRVSNILFSRYSHKRAVNMLDRFCLEYLHQHYLSASVRRNSKKREHNLSHVHKSHPKR